MFVLPRWHFDDRGGQCRQFEYRRVIEQGLLSTYLANIDLNRIHPYLFGLPLDMDLFCKCRSRAVNTRIVDATKHEHLVVGFAADAAGLAYFVHCQLYLMFYYGSGYLTVRYVQTC